LADLFAPLQGTPRPGILKPMSIYAARSNNGGEGARTRETVAPLAQRLGITVNTSYGKGDETALIAEVASKLGPTLVCWQHGEIPAMAQAFGSVTPSPPGEWPDNRYDLIWTFTATPHGWAFAQIPELVLPHDSPDVIAG
jgi:hypothetical protein